MRAFDGANNFSAFSGNVTATSLTFAWAPSTDNVGVTRYAVYTSIEPVLSSVGQTNGATTVAIGGLAPGAPYTFVVAAFDAAGSRSPFSEPTTVTLPQSGCVVVYRIVNQWQGGFQVDVTIRNGSAAAVNGWRLQWTFPGGQTIGQLWNAVLIGGSGPSVTAGDAGWNATIPAGGTVGFGFIGTGSAATPAAITLNGGGCTLG